MSDLKAAVTKAALAGVTAAANSPNIAIDHTPVQAVATKVAADVTRSYSTRRILNPGIACG